MYLCIGISKESNAPGRFPERKNERVMANKVYRVIACIGRKRNIVFESKAFDPADGCADYDAFKEAVQAREKHCMGLWGKGYSVNANGRFYHPEKKIDAGRIELILTTK